MWMEFCMCTVFAVQARHIQTKEVVAIKKMSYHGKGSQDVSWNKSDFPLLFFDNFFDAWLVKKKSLWTSSGDDKTMVVVAGFVVLFLFLASQTFFLIAHMHSIAGPTCQLPEQQIQWTCDSACYFSGCWHGKCTILMWCLNGSFCVSEMARHHQRGAFPGSAEAPPHHWVQRLLPQGAHSMGKEPALLHLFIPLFLVPLSSYLSPPSSSKL